MEMSSDHSESMARSFTRQQQHQHPASVITPTTAEIPISYSEQNYQSRGVEMSTGLRYGKATWKPLLANIVNLLVATRNKKFELMLMRRARAYSSSCSQIILVYLHPFRRNSLFCSQKSPKNHKKTNIFTVQGHLKSSMLTFLKSSLLALVMMSGMSVPMSNHFHARQANSG